jgi:hypothetical protein
MAFSPKGESAKITFAAGNIKRIIALPPLAASNPAIRLAITKNGSAAWLYVNLGDSEVDVSVDTGMPMHTGDCKIMEIPVSNGETHLAVVFGGSMAYEIQVTGGGLV